MFDKIKKKIKKRKLRKGLDAWYKIIMDMEASDEYSEELMNNVALWFAEACLQYSGMIIEQQ